MTQDDIKHVEAQPKVDKDTGVKIVGGKMEGNRTSGVKIIDKNNPTGEPRETTRVNKTGR